jgi:hypothetical protein
MLGTESCVLTSLPVVWNFYVILQKALICVAYVASSLFLQYSTFSHSCSMELPVRSGFSKHTDWMLSQLVFDSGWIVEATWLIVLHLQNTEY